MAKQPVTQKTTKPIMRRLSSVLYPSHVEQLLKMRGISKTDINRALALEDHRTDSKTGHEIYRLGDLLVVAQRDGCQLSILTAAYADSLAEYAAG
jgi:hypothetical protein